MGPVTIHWIKEDFSLEENSPVFSPKKTSGVIAHRKDNVINETLQIMRKHNHLNNKYCVDHEN